MNFDGIPGDTTAKGFEKWIHIESFQFGVGRAIGTAVGKGVVREGSQPSVSEITVTKLLDTSTPKLIKAATVDRKGVKVKIAFVTSDSDPATYLEYDLTDTLISGYSTSSGGDRPTETLSLNFTEFQISYTPTGEDNSSAAPGRFGYDLSKAAAV